MTEHKSPDFFLKLEEMKRTIEGMTKNHQIEILKIMKTHVSVKINENKSGVFVNLSFLPEKCLDEIHHYLTYVHDQEDLLLLIESKKNIFKNTFFTENNLENY
jgi:hypothetical protein